MCSCSSAHYLDPNQFQHLHQSTLEVMTVTVQAVVASDQVKTNDNDHRGVTTHWIISVESGAKWRSVAASAGSLYTEYLPS